MYCRRLFISSWTTATIVNLPAKGPQEVRLSEDLEDQDIKAGGDDFQKETCQKILLMLRCARWCWPWEGRRVR